MAERQRAAAEEASWLAEENWRRQAVYLMRRPKEADLSSYERVIPCEFSRSEFSGRAPEFVPSSRGGEYRTMDQFRDFRQTDREQDFLSETSSGYPQLLQPMDETDEWVNSRTALGFSDGRAFPPIERGFDRPDRSDRSDRSGERFPAFDREQRMGGFANERAFQPAERWDEPAPWEEVLNSEKWTRKAPASRFAAVPPTAAELWSIRQTPRRTAPRHSGVYFSTGHHYGFGPHASPGRGSII
eukprot:Protomagalhaensia_sp_Gyna_25__1974@NODE_2054_length_1320_cov_2_991413_g1696_i0_p1_GENE_NODE_2054_length_1320_cov_2_991413_g1696_i0NODE_2054_length_1320_cov_2_991413_g1696_i0_p1_ORF_typecomplete_len243_score36_26PAM2/PF07145_15/0_33_NODE_2054_length_1320_cov_2_991413_g1696_i0126854